jgi:excisionase family DNA binding protein
VGDRMLSNEQAAEWLGVSPRFVRRLVEERRIPFSRLGPAGSHIRIAESDLRAFVAAGRVEPIRPADTWRAIRGVA